MTKDAWLVKHPYLHGMGHLHMLMDAVLAEVSIPIAGVPEWSAYISDFEAGIPLLLSSSAAIDLCPVASAFSSFVQVLASKPLPEKLAHETIDLAAELHSDLRLPRRTIAWLLERDGFWPRHPGLLYYLGWTVMARHLHKLVAEFKNWRKEEHWVRSYCPVCGAVPAMAQLISQDLARLRFLSCGCCATLWLYRRTGCPFCETEDDRRLGVLSIEGENTLRIQYCEVCGGYLKTYTGEGSEDVFLSDWTSLHLDVIAQDRGLKRHASSLYQL